jgi:cysteine desulfurase/selenocysteine lyase
MGGNSNSTASHTNKNSARFFDINQVRADFPILQQDIYGKPLVYLDNAATTQKPKAVIDTLIRYYTMDNSNIHRGVHTLSMRATNAYEAVRETVRAFLGASDTSEIVFVRGATEGINLIAGTYGAANVGEGDEVIITNLEHHSNIVPWQMLCNDKGATLRVVPMNERGELELDEYRKLLSPRTKIAAISYVSNALGTVNPVKEMIELAHEKDIPVLLDGAQAVPHFPVDVGALGCEFFVFSAHKVYGPTGTGAVYARKDLLEKMPPYQGGGDMIAYVTFEKTTYNRIPHKFEAGTPNIAGVIGMGAGLDYVSNLGWDGLLAHENDVVHYATERIGGVNGVKLIGTPAHRAGVVSFEIEGVHPHDAGTILDREAIAIRAGHHCSQPIMDFYKVPATIRASFGLYNTRDEVDRLIGGINKVIEVFA